MGWQKDFNTYCHPKLKVMFISHFEKFVTQHIRIFWGLDEIQVSRPTTTPDTHRSLCLSLSLLVPSQLKFRTYNIGRGYWEAKNAKFLEVRQKLGFVMA
jgi:hypothetical protein